MFKNFLDKQSGETMWVAIASRVFYGRNNLVDTIKGVFILEKAIYFSGDTKLSIGDASILIKDVVAWGKSTPSFN